MPRMALTNGNSMKMKSLFAPYLSLMHAFKIRADDCIEILKESHYTPVDILREYATLKIDGGRQSGKTKAVAEFAAAAILLSAYLLAVLARGKAGCQFLQAKERPLNKAAHKSLQTAAAQFELATAVYCQV